MPPGRPEVGRRWDVDEVGRGIASGRAFAPDVESLLDALRLPDWIAESPEAHLLPHIRRATDGEESPWQIESVVVEDAVLVVTLRWLGSDNERASARGDAFNLIGAFAESTTSVRQQWTGSALEFDIATGQLEGDGQFAPHGHLVRLLVIGDRVTRHG